MKIRYFAWLKHRVGRGEEEVSPPAEVATVADLQVWLAQRHPGFAEALAAPGIVRAAVNMEYVEAEAAVGPGDEVAFFPPVTGG